MNPAPHTDLEPRCRGAVLGLALGDALGAPHEGGPLERLLWRWLGHTRDGRRRFTDDTRMALDLADSLLRCGKVDQDDLAAAFAESYRWSRGYGPAAARVLKRIRSGNDWQQANRSVHRSGSFGNGGAMRAPIVGIFFHARPERIATAARATAEVTHAHPLAMDGAAMIAVATGAALAGADPSMVLESAAQTTAQPEYTERFEVARRWLATGAPVSPREVRARLGMGITAPASCVTALYLAARFREQPLLQLLAFAAAAGGDVDTIGAMAGALWGAANGAAGLPADAIAHLEAAEHIDDVARRLAKAARSGA
ncbi:MAG: ADP-ribosylglycohydrolase family protein [Planctomycetes bacterium]|jgi:ADP-ribosylglycohydrolase|nr:ADP-ribosylglycohydrolase family protein [Planctomycetota bacterium]